MLLLVPRLPIASLVSSKPTLLNIVFGATMVPVLVTVILLAMVVLKLLIALFLDPLQEVLQYQII